MRRARGHRGADPVGARGREAGSADGSLRRRRARALIELRLTGLPRARIDAASALLFAHGATGLQEDWLPGEAPPPRQPWDEVAPPEPDRVVLRAWFEAPDRAAVGAAVAGFAEVGWFEVEDRDWTEAWKEGLGPVRIGADLVVAPPWDAPPGALVVEPGQGFGTGHHPTTVQALRAVVALAPGLRTALDVGTGSGVLALAAARLGLDVEGIDVEEPAIRDAVRNALRNGLHARFSTTPLARLAGPYDLVLANLHAELVARLAPDLARVTGRWLVIAGVLADREAVAHVPGLEPAHREVEGEWVCTWWRRP